MAYNPSFVIFSPTLTALQTIPTTGQYNAAYVAGSVTPGDGMGGWYIVEGGVWTAAPFAVDFNNPQDGQPIVFNGTAQPKGAITNQLVGANIQKVTTASVDINGNAVPITVADPPMNIGGIDMVAGDTVFLFGQTNPVENIVYHYEGDGVPLMPISSYSIGTVRIIQNSIVIVTSGYATSVPNAPQVVAFQMVQPNPSTTTVVIGTDPINWSPNTGYVIPRQTSTFNRGPISGTLSGIESFDRIYAFDLPGIWNGDSAFVTFGRQIAHIVENLGYASGYSQPNTPLDQHEQMVQRAQYSRNNRIWLDRIGQNYGTTIGGSTLTDHVIYCEGAGQHIPVIIFTDPTSRVLSLTGCSNVRFYGNLHIRYQQPANSGVSAIEFGSCNDLYFDRITLENCANGLVAAAGTNMVHIRQLVLINCSGTGVLTQGSSGTPVTNFQIDEIVWINTPSGMIVAEANNFTGAPGIDGLIINGGYGSGEANTYVQDASSPANAPQNCSVTLTSTGPTAQGFWIKQD